MKANSKGSVTPQTNAQTAAEATRPIATFFLISGVVSIVTSAVLLFVWPVVFGVLISIGQGIVGLGPVGAGIYAFFLLISSAIFGINVVTVPVESRLVIISHDASAAKPAVPSWSSAFFQENL